MIDRNGEAQGDNGEIGTLQPKRWKSNDDTEETTHQARTEEVQGQGGTQASEMAKGEGSDG